MEIDYGNATELVKRYFNVQTFGIIPESFTELTKELIKLGLDDIRIDPNIKTHYIGPSPAGVYRLNITQTLFYTSFSENSFSREYEFMNPIEKLDLDPKSRLEDCLLEIG